MKNDIFEGEIRLRRPQGQISQPFWFKNDEKVIVKQEIHQNRPRGQISQPVLHQNSEQVIFIWEIHRNRPHGQIYQPCLLNIVQNTWEITKYDSNTMNIIMFDTFVLLSHADGFN